jgi:Ferredoxin-like domain in Api92-like protein
VNKLSNKCFNRLVVSGKESKDFNLRFKGLSADHDISVSEKVYCFNSLVPVPESNLSDYKEWAKANWGTSGDVYGKVRMYRISKKTFNYFFETRWTTPYNWLSKVAKMFPDAKFTMEYVEPLIEVGGEYSFESGTLSTEKYDNSNDVLKRINDIAPIEITNIVTADTETKINELMQIDITPDACPRIENNGYNPTILDRVIQACVNFKDGNAYV